MERNKIHYVKKARTEGLQYILNVAQQRDDDVHKTFSIIYRSYTSLSRVDTTLFNIQRDFLHLWEGQYKTRTSDRHYDWYR